ncbi:MAG: TonB-dependent receptor plug domain-containing protein [Deltaproteobacteria bacterium]|jgi:hemoglobin/transferrin/lactoferrin receptor protein|nr:TonB-dependent receptor plug domain-containing protein [Deltaproteobacteria bacterium]
MGNSVALWLFKSIIIKLLSGIIAIIYFCLGGLAEARDEEGSGSVSLETITVTSTRVARDLSEVPLSVSVIGEKQIEEKPLPDTVDYIRSLPGVQADQNNYFGHPNFSIRGYGSERTLILIDGIKQKISSTYLMSSGGYAHLDPSEIERVEVIKGPASALYGTDAIGGVINIITKKGGDKPVSFNVGLKYDGSYETLIPRAAIFGTYKGFYYRVSGSGFTSNDMVTQN